jgi:2,5-diketo-D-gluconate reductase B
VKSSSILFSSARVPFNIFISFIKVAWYNPKQQGIKMIDQKNIHTFGIGTFRLDLTDRDGTLKALQFSFSQGQNFIDTSHLYENGKNMAFLADFFKTIDREKIFIITNVEKYVERIADVETQLDAYLKMMGLDYVDCLQLHEPAVSKIPLLETFGAMNQMAKKGKTRFLGAANTNLEDLQSIQNNFKLFHFSGVFNLECKIYEKLGVLDYCAKNDILFVAYQALRRNRTANRNYPILAELSQKYKKSQNQIILNWIAKEKKIRALIKASEVERIKENLAALDFTIEDADMEKLNAFESSEFSSIKIDWQNSGDGVVIHQLPNQLN